MSLDEMRYDLGVRSSLKNVPFSKKAFFQFEIVFDNPIVDNDETSRAVPVGMRVFFCRPAMRGPARMPDAVLHARGYCLNRADFLVKRMDPPCRARDR